MSKSSVSPPGEASPTVAFTAPVVTPGGASIINGRYEVRGLLGAGGMGSVYLAYDSALDEVVALKLLRPELVESPAMVERFRREVKLARRITQRNVARVFDIGECPEGRYLTMEYVDGEPLSRLLEREGRLAPPRAVHIASELCRGLSAAHAAGVVHRDLKPDNVLIARDGRVVVTDFGVARSWVEAHAGPAMTGNLVVGTPEYMAPEQVEASPEVDGRADFYALGVLLFEMLTGERPWKGDSVVAIAAARLLWPPPDPRSHLPLPEPLAKLVLRLMARRPADRFASASEVAEALSQLTLPSFSTPPVRPSMGSAPLTPRSMRARAPAEAGPRALVVMPLGSTDGSNEGAALGALVADMLGAQPKIAVRPLAEAERLARLGGSGRAVGRALSAEAWLEGQGGRGGLSLKLSSVADGNTLWQGQLDAGGGDPFVLAGEAASAVLASFGLPPSPLVRGPADREAASLYLRARAESRASLDRAVALYEGAIGRAPEDPWINAGYASALLARFAEAETSASDVVEAEVMAKKAVSGAPFLAEGWVSLARARLELGDAAGALGQIDRLRALGVSPAQALVVAGEALLSMGHLERALEQLRAASELEPSSPQARLAEAQGESLSGSGSRAEPLFSSARGAELSSAEFWVSRARAALYRGDRSGPSAWLGEIRATRFARAELCVPLLEVASGKASPLSVRPLFAHHAELSLGAPRRLARYREIEAELSALAGDAAGCVSALEGIERHGAPDASWLARCPLLKKLESSAGVRVARDRLLARASQTLGAAPSAPAG